MAYAEVRTFSDFRSISRGRQLGTLLTTGLTAFVLYWMYQQVVQQTVWGAIIFMGAFIPFLVVAIGGGALVAHLLGWMKD